MTGDELVGQLIGHKILAVEIKYECNLDCIKEITFVLSENMRIQCVNPESLLFTGIKDEN